MDRSAETPFDSESGAVPIPKTGEEQGATHIFLHDVVSFEPEFKETATVPGRDRDIDKALVIAGARDLVCISSGACSSHLELLSGLGIGPLPENVIRLREDAPSMRRISYAAALLKDAKQIDEICRKIPSTGGVVLNPYISTPENYLLAKEIAARIDREVPVTGGAPPIVSLCIQKHRVREIARDLGIPVAPGETVELETGDGGMPSSLRPIEEAVDRHIETSGAVVIKSAIAVLTSKIIQVRKGPDSIQAALRRIEQTPGTSTYLVEVMYDVRVSPNIVFHVEPGTGPVRCVGITDQRLSPNLAHHGNTYPSQALTLQGMVEAAGRFSEWLQSESYCGIVGYDFCEYTDPDTGRPSFFLAEVNPRMNGSVYPLSIMAQLAKTRREGKKPSLRAFLSAKWLETRARSFEEMKERLGHLFFAPGKSGGIVPYNTSCLDRGIIDIAVVGPSPGEVRALFEETRKSSLSR